MTKKKTQTNVVEKATTIVKKTTESIKKPTIASLKKEQENLTQQLVHANKRVLELEADLIVANNEVLYQKEAADNFLKTSQKYYQEIQRLKESLGNRDRQIAELTKPFSKKVIDTINRLFGN